MKIQIKVFPQGKIPKIIDKGDWIDLYSYEDATIKAPQAGTLIKDGDSKVRNVTSNVHYIPLGVAMKLPKGYEAHLVLRSSTPSKWGIIQANSLGVIDCTYCGNNDMWKLPVLAFREIVIPKDTRICQFRVQLSQKATMWQKLKWLLTSKIELEQVGFLDNTDRGGFGSTN